jgi:hypothetical protein
VKTLLWLLFFRWVWVETATVVASKNDKGAALASFAWSMWAQRASVEAGNTGESAGLASVRFVGEGSVTNFGGRHES